MGWDDESIQSHFKKTEVMLRSSVASIPGNARCREYMESMQTIISALMQTSNPLKHEFP